MLSASIEKQLNHQVKLEGQSSNTYLAMASWAENAGYEGVASFMYRHSDEERMHMLKLIKYINERGGKACVPALEEPNNRYKNLQDVFESLLQHEQHVTNEINGLVHMSLDEKDYTTHNFLQWYVSEQLEEEALARTILDKLRIIGNDSGSGLYLFDRDILNISATTANDIAAG